MAVYVKPIPTLTGEAARRFCEKAEDNARNKRGSIDFSKQVEEMRKILSKSKFGW